MSPSDSSPPDESALTGEDRAAMRAYLARSEVRLSTLHRIAVSMLSGAGILVLLPTLGRESIETVMRGLLDGDVGLRRGAIAAAVVLALGMSASVIWMLLLELTRFYFHANHLDHSNGSLFAPRLTLTGLRLASDEVSPAAAALLAEARAADHNVALIVPPNARSRAKIDRQIAAYPGLAPEGTATDRARADALFRLVASYERTLTDEVAKVEYGMARHILRVQVIVLRYVKALLIVLTTALATYVMAAALATGGGVDPSAEAWIIATMLLWAPAVLIAATAPVRLLDRLLRMEGAEHAEVGNDHELTRLETITARVSSIVWLVAGAAGLDLIIEGSGGRRAIGVAFALAGSAGLMATALRRFAGHHLFERLLSPNA